MSDPTIEALLALAKVMDARFEATQAQYATMMTNMEVIKQQMQNNQDMLMMSKFKVELKSTPTETDKALAEINATLKRIAQTLEKHEEI